MARQALKDIEIYAPNVNQNGSFNKYAYNNAKGVQQSKFPITDLCERSAQLMGDDYVRLRFNLTAYVPMSAFSFIRYDGQTFFLMDDYRPQSKGSEKTYDSNGNAIIKSNSYEYDVKFYSVANMLRKPICYRHVVVSGESWDEPEISVSATLETMYVIIIGSIEQYTSRLNSSFLFKKMLDTLVANGKHSLLPYTPGENVKLTANTELSTFNFNGDNIADVCTSVANQFSDEKKETEWYIEENTSTHALILHFCKCDDEQSMNQADDFSYKNTEGADKHIRPVKRGGLSKVEYSRDTSNIPQLIVPYGAERNMTYQAVKGIDEISQMQSTFGKRLRLKTNHTCTINGVTYPTAAMQAKGMTGAYAVKDKSNNIIPLGVDSHGGIANDQVNTGVERVEFFDDIYPQCHFVVSDITERTKRQDGMNIPEYTCEGKVVDSEGHEVQPEGAFYPIQIEEGTTLSVRFESGFLNGREFEIANKTQKKTNPSTGQPETNYTLRFTIVADGSIEDGTLIPSGNFKPMVGDKFALFNMKMPEAYITYAQEELAQKAYEKLIEYQETVPDVKCTSSPDDFARCDMYFGTRYTINSEKLGFTTRDVVIDGVTKTIRVPVDFVSRVVAYSYKLTKPHEIQFTLSSALVRGVLSEMAAAITNVSYATEGLGQRSINLSRRGWRDASEVADMISSVTTEMMLVGNAKYQFGYTSEVKPIHSNGAFIGLAVSYGQLQHTQEPYIGYANGGMWQIQPASENSPISVDVNGNALDGTKPYYVFAICGTDNLEWASVVLMDKEYADTNNIYRKDTEIDTENDNYPQYLLLGILSSEFAETKNGQATNERVFSPTNGFTAIEGGTITTEQIQDANRQLIIDFQSFPPRIIARGGAEIIGNITFKSFKDESGNNPLVSLGRNLLRDTAFKKKGAEFIGWTFYNGSSSSKTLGGCSFKTNADDNTIESGAVAIDIKANHRVMLTQTAAHGYNTKDEVYTFSAKVKSSVGDTDIYFGAGYSDFPDNYGKATIGTSYTTITLQAKVPAMPNGVTNYAMFFMRLLADTAAVITVKEAKLEKGTFATSWIVAPEDTAADIVENKNYIDAIEEDLQKQIDGVIDSYFMKGVPTMSNRPVTDWQAEEGWDESKYAQHEGDTYTNIQNYNALDVGNWEQGVVWVGSAQIGKSLEQNKDNANYAVRYKELISYKEEDVLHIGKGDVNYIIYVAYYDDNGKYSGVCETKTVSASAEQILVLSSSYAFCSISIRHSSQSAITKDIVPPLVLCINITAGHSWRFCNFDDDDDTTWHWHEIADSDAVLALQQAAAAQDTADGKRRVFSTAAGVLPTPPYDTGDLWANATYDANGSVHRNALLKCIEAKAKGETAAIADWTDASRAISAADMAQATADNIADDGIISGGTEKANIKKEWQAIAGDNMSGGTTAPKTGSYYNAITQAEAYGISSSDTLRTTLATEYGYLDTLMNAIMYKTVSGSQVSAMDDDTYIGGKRNGTTAYDITMTIDGTSTQVSRDVFCKLWRRYYDAEIALLNKVSDIIDKKEIGGENLYTKEDPLTISNEYETGIVLGSGKKYVISYVSKTGSSPVMIREYDGTTLLQSAVLGTYDNDTNQKVVVTGRGGMLKLSLQFGSITVTGIMVQIGEKPTTYQPSYKYLAEAFEHDARMNTTDIDGGLVSTSLIKLRKRTGGTDDNPTYEVTAGMSGIDDVGKKANAAGTGLETDANAQGVTMWGGGDYVDALKAAAGLATLPILLTKTGIGSMIGCFKVASATEIQVKSEVTENGTTIERLIRIDTGTGGIRMVYGGVEKIVIAPGNISDFFTKEAITHNSLHCDYPSTGYESTKETVVKLGGNSAWSFTAQKDNGSITVSFSNHNISRLSSSTHTGTTVVSVPNKSINLYLVLKSSDANESEKVTFLTGVTTGSDGMAVFPSSMRGTISGLKRFRSYTPYLRYVIEEGYFIGYSMQSMSNDPALNVSLQTDYTNPITVIAKDGVLVTHSDMKTFCVKTTSSGQQILMTGLPTSQPDTVGQLWNDGGVIKIRQ